MTNAFQAADEKRRKREAEGKRLEQMAAAAREGAVAKFRGQLDEFLAAHRIALPVETRGDSVLVGSRDDGIRATAQSGSEFTLAIAAAYAGDVWERKRDANRKRVSFDDAAAQVVDWLHKSGRLRTDTN